MRFFQLLCLSASLLVASVVQAERFSFVALGDTAYNGEPDKAVYRTLIDTVNAAKPAFTIHVGDLWGVSYCNDARFDEAATTFQRFDHPLIYTPGDNEWTDCYYRAAGAFDPVDRLARLRKVFFSKPTSLGGGTPLSLASQGQISPFKDYVENVRWSVHDVLFFTANIPGSGNNFRYNDLNALQEAHARNIANIAWIRDSFRIAREQSLKAVVLAVHAEMFRDGHAEEGLSGPHGMLVGEIRTAAERYGKPVLLIHGDSHEFIIDRPFLESQGEGTPPKYANITRLEVFGAPEVRAVQVTVDTDKPWVFGFEPLYNQ